MHHASRSSAKLKHQRCAPERAHQSSSEYRTRGATAASQVGSSSIINRLVRDLPLQLGRITKPACCRMRWSSPSEIPWHSGP
eukprot:270222-Pyramimonas_sp.AAC.1